VESTIKEGAANYWTGRIARGGRLFLTSSTIQFVPHKVEKVLGGQVLEIPLRDVTAVTVTPPPTPLYGFRLHVVLQILWYTLFFPLSWLIAGLAWIIRASTKWVTVTTASGGHSFRLWGQQEWVQAIEGAVSVLEPAPERRPETKDVTGLPATTAASSASERLRELRRLRDERIITEDEFETKKKDILDQL